MSFGTVNPYAGFPYSTSANVTYSCTNRDTSAHNIYLCASLGTGTGGTNGTDRTLSSGSSTIPIKITNGANATQIGDNTSYPMEGPLGPIGITANGSATGSVPLAVTMPAPPSAPPPGNYSSSFSSPDAELYYVFHPATGAGSAAPVSCAALMSETPASSSGHIVVSAVVARQCTVSATSLAFPTRSALTAPVTATATISVSCNASTPVTIALDNGATGTGPTARQMKSGANAITYGIYQDSGATMPWGSTSGTDTASLGGGTGTLTAYGRVPAQASPPPGSYADVVNVTVTYRGPGQCLMLAGTVPPLSATFSITALCSAMFCSALPSAPAWTLSSFASSLRASRLELRSSSLSRSTIEVW